MLVMCPDWLYILAAFVIVLIGLCALLELIKACIELKNYLQFKKEMRDFSRCA